MTINRLGKE